MLPPYLTLPLSAPLVQVIIQWPTRHHRRGVDDRYKRGSIVKLRKAILFAALLSHTIAGQLAGQQPPSLDPGLRLLLRPEGRALAERTAPTRHIATGDPRLYSKAFVLDRLGPADDEVRVHILVQINDSRGLTELTAKGAELGAVAGDVVTARVPLGALEGLSRSPLISRLEAARPTRVQGDLGTTAIEANTVRRREDSNWYGSTGHGTLVGIYDTGIDYQHPAFLDAQGRTRVLALLDQSWRYPGATRGATCRQDELRHGTCPPDVGLDTLAHGTHVAGIAAGGGGGSPEHRYAGVAPGADLIAVKTDFTTAGMLDGTAWIFEQADFLERPAVVNLSLGSHFGPRDGTSLLARGLENLSGPGRIIVVAAGNNGWHDNTQGDFPHMLRHAQGRATVGMTDTLSFRVPEYARQGICTIENIDFAVLELWYAPEDSLEVSIVRPDGSSTSAGPGKIVRDDHASGGIMIDNASAGADPRNGDYEAYVEIDSCEGSGSPLDGLWRILLTPTASGSGTPYNLWISWSQFGPSLLEARGKEGFDNTHSIAVPATANDILAVGSYVTRHCVPTAQGTKCIEPALREQEGDIAYYSSTGPTRDGRFKPEIAAPGRLVISACPQDPDTGRCIVAEGVTPDGLHYVSDGTSMAAPHVTGTIATLLQHDGALTTADILSILENSAVRDAFTEYTHIGEGPGLYPNNQWGFGKLNTRTALLEMGALESIAMLELSPILDTLPVGATQRIHTKAYDGAGQPAEPVIHWASSDPLVAAVDGEGGVQVRGLGNVTITASANGVSRSISLFGTPPATLVARAERIDSPHMSTSRQDSRIPLLRLHFNVDGHEAVDLGQLGFMVTGHDPEARVLILRDLFDDGEPPAELEPIAEATVRLTPRDTAFVTIETEGVRIPRSPAVSYVVAIEMSGGAPNHSDFRVHFLPDQLRAVGALSKAEDKLDAPLAAIGSLPARTTVLDADEVFSLSENPVRSGEVVFSFSTRPTVAAIYSLNGQLVANLLPRIDAAGLVTWDLTNDHGSTVAAGIYLVVFQVAGQRIRERLVVTRPRPPEPEGET